MTRKYWFKVLVGVLFLAIFLGGCDSADDSSPPFVCQDDIGCVTINPDEPVRIGVLQVQSGETAVFGTGQINSVQIAVADRDGTLLNHPIELTIEDSLCLEEGGTTAALKIVADPQLVGVVGTTCSGSAVSASRIISEAGLVMVSGSNTAASLTYDGNGPGEDWQPGFFRTIHNDLTTGSMAAVFTYQELGILKAATLNDGDTYTVGLTNAFARDYVALGGEIVLEATLNKGDVDMIPILTAIAESGADMLFMPIFEPEGNYIMLQKAEVEGLDDISYFSGDGLFSRTFIDAVGDASMGMYFGGAASASGEQADHVLSSYQEMFGEPPPDPTYAFAYDAANLLFKAIEDTTVVESDGTLHVLRGALRDALRNTRDLQAVTGMINCDEFGDCSGTSFTVVQVSDSQETIDAIAQNVVFTFTPD